MPTARMKRLWLATLVGALTVLLAVVLIGFRQAPEGDASPDVADSDAESQSQPVQFPHDTHAGQFTIPCQYCHFSAERSVDAGIPPMSACMGCHQEGIVDGRTDQAQAEIAKVREYYESGKAHSVEAHLQGARPRQIPPYAPHRGRRDLPDLPRRGAGDGGARRGGSRGGGPEDGLVRLLSRRARGLPRLHGMSLLRACGWSPRHETGGTNPVEARA